RRFCHSEQSRHRSVHSGRIDAALSCLPRTSRHYGQQVRGHHATRPELLLLNLRPPPSADRLAARSAPSPCGGSVGARRLHARGLRPRRSPGTVDGPTGRGVMRFDGKVALNTGAGSGTGKAPGGGFAQRGGAVGVGDVNQETATSVVTEITRAGGRATAI